VFGDSINIRKRKIRVQRLLNRLAIDYSNTDDENIEIQLEQFDTDVIGHMTLILGARCIDGVVLAADRKFPGTDTVGGIHITYNNSKITGELDGILTGLSGDVGTFQLFIISLRNHVNQAGDGIGFDAMMLRVSEIQREFYDRYENYRYKVLMGVASKYSSVHRSSLYYFESDGRCLPKSEPKAIGSGSPYAYYFLKRYWHENQTTMEQFAQLSDFIIRYIGNSELPLDDAVGLDGQDNQYQYPQIVFIPDDPEFCKIYNGGLPKVDCSPTTARLIEFRHNSENMINILRQIPAPWGPLSVHF
jgi:20S proteasome alpha/beta subunit